jgi:hypothetical protein
MFRFVAFIAVGLAFWAGFRVGWVLSPGGVPQVSSTQFRPDNEFYFITGSPDPVQPGVCLCVGKDK